MIQALNTHPSKQIVSFSTQNIAGFGLYSSDKQPQRVYSSLVQHIPLFSLFTFPLIKFDNQLNEGEVFTAVVCLLPIVDFRGGSCVVTCGLRTKLLCWRLVLSPGTKFWKNKGRTCLDTNANQEEEASSSNFIILLKNGLALNKLCDHHKRSALHLSVSRRWRSGRIWDLPAPLRAGNEVHHPWDKPSFQVHFLRLLWQPKATLIPCFPKNKSGSYINFCSKRCLFFLHV